MTAAHRTSPARDVPPEAETTARGAIRTETPLSTRYGTAYGLLDGTTAGHDRALKSDALRLAEYVGDRVRVSGPPTLAWGVPVTEVTGLDPRDEVDAPMKEGC